MPNGKNARILEMETTSALTSPKASGTGTSGKASGTITGKTRMSVKKSSSTLEDRQTLSVSVSKEKFSARHRSTMLPHQYILEMISTLLKRNLSLSTMMIMKAS